jgi:ATP-dependent RNA helicase CshB
MYDTYLKELKFKDFTPIQKASFFAYQKKSNIVGIAPTGTGKTLAYGIPVIDQIKSNLSDIQAIILLPTQELIHQVHDMLSPIRSTVKMKKVIGQDYEQTLLKVVSHPPHVLITTPHKLLSLIQSYQLSTKFVKDIIFDEADMFFEKDFLEDIESVLRQTNYERVHLFSASLSNTMKPLINRYFGKYTLVSETKALKPNISYFAIEAALDQKVAQLKHIVTEIKPYLGLIFVSKKEDIEILEKALSTVTKVVSMSSKDTSKIRLQKMKRIQALDYEWVITSDVMARGIDLTVSHVISYDIPKPLSFWMHRVGRTGRMGQSGIAITLYHQKEREGILKLINQGYPLKKATIKDGEIVLRRVKKQADPIVYTHKKPKRIKPNYKKKMRENRGRKI